MSDLKLLITGCKGRMGQAIIRAAEAQNVTVAATIERLSEQVGADHWILSGWPLAAEARRFAEQVIPLLSRELAPR